MHHTVHNSNCGLLLQPIMYNVDYLAYLISLQEEEDEGNKQEEEEE